MKIKLNIEPAAPTFYRTEKPESDRPERANQPETIRGKLCKAASIAEVTPEKLAEEIARGLTFTRGAMTGGGANTWQSQQILVADIDNDKKGPDGKTLKDEHGQKVCIDNPLTPKEAADLMAKNGLTPCIMYYSFSNKDTHPKFRIILLLPEPVTDPAEAVDLNERFNNLFATYRPDSTDRSTEDNARFFYGTTAANVFYLKPDNVTPLDAVKALPAPQKEEPKRREPKPWTPAPRAASLWRLNEQLKRDRDAFPLLDYVTTTTGGQEVQHGQKTFVNPCPICGHRDDFNIEGHLWHCFGGSTDPKTGGTIIDYLMHREGLTEPQALEKFKFELMGYDREEWAAAWKAENAGATSTTTTPATSATAAPSSSMETPEPPEPLPVNTSEFLDKCFTKEAEDFEARYKTGFKKLDQKAGGIYSGLYTIAAASSLGKTTFVCQIADQLAEQGADVLFFSLEQSTFELVTKSIARQTAQDSLKTRGNASAGLTSLMIRREGLKRKNVRIAAQEYKNRVRDRVTIIQGNFNCSAWTIREKVEQYIKETGRRPVVIVDYLQMLQPPANLNRGGAREIIDAGITELKRITRDHNLTMFVVSAVNRSNYLVPVSFEALKESSAIEYTSDVILGLHYTALTTDPLFTGKTQDPEKQKIDKRERIKEEKRKSPREVQLVCLKDRYGIGDYSQNFLYYSAFDLFVEDDGKRDEWEPLPDNLPII